MKRLTDLQGQRKEKENRLAQLTRLKDQTVSLSAAEDQLNDFCSKVPTSLDTCTLETRRLALDILNAQVAANPQKCEVTYKNPSRLTYH